MQDIPNTLTKSTREGEEHEEGGHAHGLDPLDFDADTGFFLQSLNSHQRSGFLWQKLRQPRTFDYATTKTKRYDERLADAAVPVQRGRASRR